MVVSDAALKVSQVTGTAKTIAISMVFCTASLAVGDVLVIAYFWVIALTFFQNWITVQILEHFKETF
jgi:hypothetical protein